MAAAGATPKRERVLRRCADAFLKLLDRIGGETWWRGAWCMASFLLMHPAN